MKRKYFGVLLGAVCLITSNVLAQAVDEELVLEETQEKNILPDIPSVQLTYTWADFLQGKSCLNDFNRLNALDFISQRQQFLKDKMQMYCIGQKKDTAWSDLLVTFRQCKKNLLINKTLKENGVFWGYIKSAPYFLFDIHDTVPNGNTLNGKLDLIQNAIQNKEPEKVLLEMQNLQPEDQLYLTAVFNEAGSLVDFRQALSGSEVNYD